MTLRKKLGEIVSSDLWQRNRRIIALGSILTLLVERSVSALVTRLQL